jgi:hypothetical protein
MIIVAFVLALLMADGRDAEFRKYPAEAKLSGKPAAPMLSTAKARRYRTMLRSEAKLGANFNGHYRIAHWGCGTNCLEWAIIDLQKGNVWRAPAPLFSCAGARTESLREPDSWFDARIDSSLLYVHSCRGNGRTVFDTRTVYRHRNNNLVVVRVVAIE